MSKLPKAFLTAFEVYTSTNVLGEGGTGRVFEVENAAGEKFALKCLLPERVNEERRRRFKNEVTFCATSKHRNIVRVLDTGVAEAGGKQCPFYVMPLYDVTLRDVIASAIEPARKLALYGQLLDGVEAAHLQSVW